MENSSVVLEDSSNMDYWSEIEPVLKEYAELLGTEIVVSNPHGHAAPALTETGKLYIRFWSTPEASPKSKILAVFGIKLKGGQDDACRPSGLAGAIPIIDPDGVAAAEVVGGTLYILFDLPHASGGGPLMRAIMEQYVALQKSSEERARMMAKQAEAERQRSRQAWIKECSRRLEKTASGTREAITKAEQAIEAHQRQLVEQIRLLDGQRRKLEQVEATRPELERRYEQEFDKLLQVPHVVRVTAESGKISVFTDRIFVDHGGRRYDIGDFRVEVYTDGSNGCVRMYNLTRRVDAYQSGMQAPHVFPDGKPCLGNLKEAIPAYLGEYEYSIVVMLCIQYLQSVNTQDAAGKYITCWPLVEGGSE